MWCAGCTAAFVLFAPLRRRPWPRRLAVLLVGVLLACAATRQWQQLHVASAHPARVLLEGEIVSVPARDGGEFTFDAEVRIVEGPGAGGALRRARLRWRDPGVAPRAGERWRL